MPSNAPASNSALSKSERKASSYISVAFKPHEGDWMETAKRLLDEFNGKYTSAFGDKPRFTVNTIFSLVNLLLPSLLFNAPYIRTKPLQPKYMKKLADGEYLQVDNIYAAAVREAALNHTFKKINAINEHKKAVKDSFFFGFGITKVGYSYETITQMDKDYTLEDSPFVRRINPRDFGWHPLATGLDDSVFLCHRVFTTKSRLKDSGRFAKTDIAKLKSGVPKWMKEKYEGTEFLKENKDFVTLYEVHDQEQDKLFTFGSESTLLDKIDNPYQFNGSHFNMVRLADDNEEFQGIPLLASVEDECIALNEVLTLIVEHYRKFPGQVFYNIGTIDEEDVQRIKNGEQGSIHGVRDTSQLKFQQPLSMGQDYFGIVNLLNGLVDKILGVPDFTRIGSSARRSATEASYIQGDATVRREYYLQLVKEFILNDVRKVAKLQEQYQDEEEEIMATGEMGYKSFKYSKDDLQGEWDHDFDLDSLRAANELQVTNLNNTLQILASQPILQPVLKTLDPIKTGKQIFKLQGLNIESFQSDSEQVVFMNPAKENDIARRGEPMPAPRKGEDYQWHITTHIQDLQQRGYNDQIAEHIAETKILQIQEEAEKNPQPAAPPQQPPGTPQQNNPALPPQPAGPSGPGNQEGAIS
jgi:hypothetical protein